MYLKWEKNANHVKNTISLTMRKMTQINKKKM